VSSSVSTGRCLLTQTTAPARMPSLGARWGELGLDLRLAVLGGSGPRFLTAAAVPRDSPPDLARLWHGEHLIRSSSRIGQQRPYRPLRGPGGTVADGAVAGVAVPRCCTAARN
jgi:hypothetical protein